MDLRERILSCYDHEEGTREMVARRFRVSLGMVKKLLALASRLGRTARGGETAGRHELAE
jgi:hypothetical protein